MYVIILLNVESHLTSIHWIGNNLQDAQNALLLYCDSEAVKSNSSFECQVINTNEIHIYKRVNGWVSSTKTLSIIATLHSVDQYEAINPQIETD